MGELLSELGRIMPDTGKIEELSEKGCIIFYVRFFRARAASRTGYISYMPIIRARGQPLNLCSSHLPSTLISWPVAYCRRLALRSSTDRIYHAAREVFFLRLREHCWPEHLIQFFKSCSDEFASPDRPCRYHGKTGTQTWQIFEYHSVLHRGGLAGRVATFAEDAGWKSLLQSVPYIARDINLAVKVAWKLPDKKGCQHNRSSLNCWRWFL